MMLTTSFVFIISGLRVFSLFLIDMWESPCWWCGMISSTQQSKSIDWYDWPCTPLLPLRKSWMPNAVNLCLTLLQTWSQLLLQNQFWHGLRARSPTCKYFWVDGLLNGLPIGTQFLKVLHQHCAWPCHVAMPCAWTLCGRSSSKITRHVHVFTLVLCSPSIAIPQVNALTLVCVHLGLFWPVLVCSPWLMCWPRLLRSPWTAITLVNACS